MEKEQKFLGEVKAEALKIKMKKKEKTPTFHDKQRNKMQKSKNRKVLRGKEQEDVIISRRNRI